MYCFQKSHDYWSIVFDKKLNNKIDISKWIFFEIKFDMTHKTIVIINFKSKIEWNETKQKITWNIKTLLLRVFLVIIIIRGQYNQKQSIRNSIGKIIPQFPKTKIGFLHPDDQCPIIIIEWISLLLLISSFIIEILFCLASKKQQHLFA